MKNILLVFVTSFLIVSCNFQAEKTQNSPNASEVHIENFLKGDQKAIYEDASIKMKTYVSEEVFLNTAAIKEKLYGKVVDAKLVKESNGEFQMTATNTYIYQVKNEEGDSFELTTEFLNGHFLKQFIDIPLWSPEPDFAKKLVTPISNLIKDNNYEEIYNLLSTNVTLEQSESLLKKINETCDGVPSMYESFWMDNDKSGKMMVVFVYGYEGKGYLDYRFHIEKDTYPFAGIFFTPNTETTLPNN